MGFLFLMIKRYLVTGRCIILDSGFCVLEGLITLRKKGVFSCAVINKIIY